MKLAIFDANELIDIDFIKWLILRIRNTIIQNINNDKLKKWDEFFNSSTVYKNIYKKKISTRDIIISGACNLTYLTTESEFIIQINPNIFTPGLDRVKLNAICKLINFGNLEISGYKIFTDVFNKFALEISDYVDLYLSISHREED